MNRRKMRFLMLLCFLALIPSTSASGELAVGYLGYHLTYVIRSPTELKVGEDTPVDFQFQSGYVRTLFVKSIWIWIVGSRVNSSEYGINRLLAEDIELHTFESVNATILVKPLEEGIVVIHVKAEYNWTDLYEKPRDDWGSSRIVIHARMNTFDELTATESIFKNLTYILSVTTVVFIATAAYLMRRLRLKQA